MTKLFAIRGSGPLLLAAMLATGAAQAGVQTLPTISFDSNPASNYPTLNIPQFNLPGQTLNSVTLNWIVDSYIISATIQNQSLGQVTVDYIDFTRLFKAGGTSPFTSAANNTIGASANTVPTPVVLNNGDATTITNLAFAQVPITTVLTSVGSWVGAGNKVETLVTSFSATPDTIAGGDQTLSYLTSVTGHSYGTLDVSYNYSPTGVPEPSNVLLCAAPALLGCGALVRRFRKSRKNLM